MERKLQQRYDNLTKAAFEGTTYQCGVTMTHVSVITEIPFPKVMPTMNKIETNFFSSANKIYCDIETTSLHKDEDILQIAATSETESCDLYILPSKSISPASSDITGLTVIGKNMFYRGRKVDTHSLKDAILLFVKFLESHQPCVLIGHNFHTFDFPRIIRAFELTSMTDHLCKNTLGAVDTLPLFKKAHPGLEKYSQEHLVGLFVKQTYSAHNALSDVKSLQKLYTTVGVSNQQMS
ncbi:uncharacterized protein LOC123563893 [Mercenaria mercenaria]|uniref:uncharacterized protein LOC123563893 n=1 Tax=Mercenaria mercenaria TaxID=6596 RepID=UPI00234F085D|nr:uncharacterized protein LOC123563893 [Mercenaria mercenaria]